MRIIPRGMRILLRPKKAHGITNGKLVEEVAEEDLTVIMVRTTRWLMPYLL